MSNIWLVLILFVVFTFGYFVADTFGRFMDKKPRRRRKSHGERTLIEIGLNRNGVKAEPEEAHTLLDLLSDCDEGARSAGKTEEPRGKVH